MTRIRLLSSLLGGLALTACTKDAVQQITGPTAGSYVKFFNFSVNAPSVNFFAGDTKVTAISSTSCTPPTVPPIPACSTTGIESTNGTAYGSLGNAGLYSTLAPGQYQFSGRISATTDLGLSVAKVSQTLENGKFYSVYMSGIYNTTGKTTDAFVIEDPIPPQIDFTITTVRFVNAISNAGPLTVYAKNTATGDSVAIGSSIAYKGASTFVTMPGAAYDLTARAPGSNTALFTLAATSFVAGRVYTVTARGDMTVTSTTATTRPILSSNVNR